jgi:hypothetical protein
MARKKNKSFPKKQLVQLFESKNYQKVVSKIKQFSIENMTKEELLRIHLDSLENLSLEHFEIDDIQRALRDIETAIKLKVVPFYQFLRLKYICYLEKFQDAFNYSKLLLDIKDQKIKKDVVFYHLISNIYYDNTIDKNYLKYLTKTKQNYILGLLAFFKNDEKLCLKYLDECKPRLKDEKQNLEALKSIILNDGFQQLGIKKPLYRFLTLGDSGNLQNTKSTREIKPIVAKSFKQIISKFVLKGLIELKNPIDTILLKQQKDIKLIYNNIALLLEIDNNYKEALKLFIYYKDKLIDMPESIYLLIRIYEKDEERISSCQNTIWFVKKYLLKHSKKLMPFNIKYIFYEIFANMSHPSEKTIYGQYVVMADEYDQISLAYMMQELSNPYTKDIDSYCNYIEDFFSKFDKINEKVLLFTISGIDSFQYIVNQLDKSGREAMIATIDTNSSLLAKVQSLDKKYQKTLFSLFDTMSYILMEFDTNAYLKEFKNLENTINHFIKIFNYEKNNLSDNILDLFTSIKSGVNNNANNSNQFENTLDRLKKMISQDIGFTDDDDEDYDYDMNLDDKFIYMQDEFEAALIVEEDPFEFLEDFPKFDTWFYKRKYEFKVFDLMKKYSNYKTLTPNIIKKIFTLTGFPLDRELIRKRLPALVNEYTKHSADVAYEIIKYLLELHKNKKVSWYLQWIYIYLDIFYKNNYHKDAFFKKYLAKFLEIQREKEYKSFSKKYERVLKMFNIKHSGSYEQQSFDF